MSLLTLAGLSAHRGGRQTLHDVSFSVARGDAVVVMGPSGSGKSTVLRAVAGLDPFSAGTIAIDGIALSPGAVPRGAALRELHQRVGFVFQFHHLFADKRAIENVWMAPVHVSGQGRAEAERRARALLATLGVGHRADAYPHQLSGGEAQRVAIARALAMEPPLLLMDEPTASLDPARKGELAQTLRELTGQGRTIVVATHDMDFARAVADRVVVLEEGRVVRDDPAALIF